MAIHLTPEANPTVQEGTLYVDSATGEFNVAGRTTPHIIPGVLYPAVDGKLLDGTTSHSGDYGTEQSDKRSYFWTSIKGSRPIKDPRIGGHFGSQRHKFKSLQVLEQETATHGKDVYSIDGREWIRAVGSSFTVQNHSHGQDIHFSAAGDFFEVTGYFNDFNVGMFTYNNRNVDVDITIDGTLTIDGSTTLSGNSGYAGNALMSRYVDPHSIINAGLSITLGIHTLKFEIKDSGKQTNCNGIELIAQDTSNRNNIQIPSQDVVSYGKKFTVSGTPHYDPFNEFTSGSSVTSYIDTATSLGVENWKNSSTYYRPYNGGRVVRWVDSSGVIKTSVTLMPPNAQNFGGTAITPKANASAANDTYLPTFSGAIDHSLSEVAKTFFMREFGNGSANGGTGATYADASMLTGNDAIAYVMDDGLTSLAAKQVGIAGSGTANAFGYAAQYSDAEHFLTFIGTGFGFRGKTSSGDHRHDIAQNLPYGTHIFNQSASTTGSDNYPAKIDGVSLGNHRPNNENTDFAFYEITIYQPKKPPIPEDACVLADYMLMADFVVKSAGFGNISKGTRSQSASRDFHYDASGVTYRTTSLDVNNSTSGIPVATFSMSSGQSSTVKLPYFGTDFVITHYANRIGTITEDLNSDVGTSANLSTSTNAGATKHTGNNLGVNRFKSVMTDGQGDDEFWISTLEIATPIHTSHHYQSFETPFLNELVGGDRNMEQHNLVCSPDGKTWDQITRDTSYIGNVKVCATSDTDVNWDSFNILDEWRGKLYSRDWFNKDFAIAYDRIICLRDGFYQLHAQTYSNTNGAALSWYLSGDSVLISNADSPNHIEANGTVYIKRGDYLQLRGEFGTDSLSYNMATITRV